MLLFKEVRDLQAHLYGLRQAGNRIGFVPTMGALHQGHIALIERSLQESDVTVASIFVNPIQFNNPTDLEKYLRTPGIDMEMLINAGCHVLFMPEVDEVYPRDLNIHLELNFGYLTKPMEGTHRPGHFEGVAMVIKRLLDIVKPDSLFMGQKDFQQLSVIREMLSLLKMKINLVSCPTVREKDGLAMSSRNVRLTAEQRQLAPVIFKTLKETEQQILQKPSRQLEQEAMRKLTHPGMEPEYFNIVDGRTLIPVNNIVDHDFVVVCTAVRLGEVRLIDNLILKES